MINLRNRLTIRRSQTQQSRRRRSNQGANAGIEALESRELLAADATVLKDIFPGNASSLPSSVQQQTPSQPLNGWVYFNANDGTHGFELWRTDGTEANTQLFLDLTPGSGRSDPQNFMVANGKLFFTAAGGNLYVTNGTTVGTMLRQPARPEHFNHLNRHPLQRTLEIGWIRSKHNSGKRYCPRTGQWEP